MVKIQLKDTVNMFYSIKCYELLMFKDEKPQIKKKENGILSKKNFI